MVRAVNRGLRETTGEYVVKLDADDLLPAGSLERSVTLSKDIRMSASSMVGRAISPVTCLRSHAQDVCVGQCGPGLSGWRSAVG